MSDKNKAEFNEITAEMLRVICHMLKDGTTYQDQIKKLTGEDSPGKESA